jgi:hypothetical protein
VRLPRRRQPKGIPAGGRFAPDAQHRSAIAITPDEGPVERPDGSKHWIQKGLHHRIDGPALTTGDGRRFWYIHGQRLAGSDLDTHIAVLAAVRTGRLQKVTEPKEFSPVWPQPVVILTSAGYRIFHINGTRVATPPLPDSTAVATGVTAGYRRLPGGDTQQAVALDDGTVRYFPPDTLDTSSPAPAVWTANGPNGYRAERGGFEMFVISTEGPDQEFEGGVHFDGGTIIVRGKTESEVRWLAEDRCDGLIAGEARERIEADITGPQ